MGVDGSSVAGYASVEKSDILLFSTPEDRRRMKVEGEYVDAYFNSVKIADGSSHPGDPRAVLEKVVAEAKEMGYQCEMFSELEFYLLDKDGKPNDQGHYISLPPEDGSIKYRRELCHVFEETGIKVKRLHHEVGPGQNEVEYQLQPVLKNADDTVYGKWISDMVAQEYGWHTQYSPKPFPELAGSGLHQHILLRDLKGNNVMGTKDGKLTPMYIFIIIFLFFLSLSSFILSLSLFIFIIFIVIIYSCYNFIAGLLKYARDITAVFAIHKESFERLKPGHEAPTITTWGFASRNALVRIPTIGDADKIRVEFRAGDSSGSPHLLCAMILAAGLQGIKDKLEVPEEESREVFSLSVEELHKRNMDILPIGLQECVTILQTSEFVKKVCGTKIPEVIINHMEKQLKKEI